MNSSKRVDASVIPHPNLSGLWNTSSLLPSIRMPCLAKITPDPPVIHSNDALLFFETLGQCRGNGPSDTVQCQCSSGPTNRDGPVPQSLVVGRARRGRGARPCRAGRRAGGPAGRAKRFRHGPCRVPLVRLRGGVGGACVLHLVGVSRARIAFQSGQATIRVAHAMIPSSRPCDSKACKVGGSSGIGVGGGGGGGGGR
jgi:hypothetical protein